MKFHLSKVEAAMVKIATLRLDDQQQRENIAKGYIVAATDRQLVAIQKAIQDYANIYHRMQKFTEYRSYIELAQKVRDMRTSLARVTKYNIMEG
jgi:UDP-N-acetylmuramoylalanine-D-glutamate ligase